MRFAVALSNDAPARYAFKAARDLTYFVWVRDVYTAPFVDLAIKAFDVSSMANAEDWQDMEYTATVVTLVNPTQGAIVRRALAVAWDQRPWWRH